MVSEIEFSICMPYLSKNLFCMILLYKLPGLIILSIKKPFLSCVRMELCIIFCVSTFIMRAFFKPFTFCRFFLSKKITFINIEKIVSPKAALKHDVLNDFTPSLKKKELKKLLLYNI